MYIKYSDINIDCPNKDIEHLVSKMIEKFAYSLDDSNKQELIYFFSIQN